MPATVTREEFDELASEVAGEKVVSRYILDQTRRNGDDLAALMTRVRRVEEKLDGQDRKIDGLDRRMDGLDRRMDGLDRKLNELARDLPTIVADTMREVLRERETKK